MSGSARAPPTHCSVIHLEIALQDVRVQRRELVGADIDVDADVAQILLDDRRLEAVELEVRDFERQLKTWARAVAVGIAVAGLVEELRARSGS